MCECKEKIQQHQQVVAEFEQRYPNYCRHCLGNGGEFYSFDPSSSGVSLATGFMVDFENCSECVEKGRCPLCGVALPDDEPWICPGCGWDYDGPRAGIQTIGLCDEPCKEWID